MGRAANNPSRWARACENCGKPAPRCEHWRVNLISDAGKWVAAGGEVCRGCMTRTALLITVQHPETGDSGRWEVYDYGAMKPVCGGVYGREPTPQELEIPHPIRDAERSPRVVQSPSPFLSRLRDADA